jgi:uncharacterized membrane protein YfcA
MASGIFIVPFLTLFEGVSLHSAVVCSIVSVIACSCASAAPFLRGDLTNIRVATVLETATTLGALTGICLVGVLPVLLLQVFFAAILLVSAWQMMERRRQAPAEATEPSGRDWATVLRLHATYPDSALGPDVSYRVRLVPMGPLLMYGAGLISALLGIGSGVLKIPALDTALGLPIKVSSATSNFMIGATAAASGVAYFARGDINPAIAGPIALGSVIGSVPGARFVMVVSGDRLRLLFVIVIVVLAAQMLHAAFQGPSDASHDMNGHRKRDFGLKPLLTTTLQFGTWVGSCSSPWVGFCPPPASPYRYPSRP